MSNVNLTGLPDEFKDVKIQKTDRFDPKEIRKRDPNAIIIGEDEEDNKLDAKNIPDLCKLTEYISTFLDYILLDDIKKKEESLTQLEKEDKKLENLIETNKYKDEEKIKKIEEHKILKETIKTKNIEYFGDLQDKFQDFYINFNGIFRMLARSDNRVTNLEYLSKLINILKDVKAGKKDINKQFDIFREQQAEKYIYPQFGGKKKFEEKLKERNKNKK